MSCNPVKKFQGETAVFTCFVEDPNTNEGVAPTSITVRILDPSDNLIVAVNDAAAEVDTDAGPDDDDTGYYRYEYPFAANAELGGYRCKFKVTDGDDSRISEGVSYVVCAEDEWAS